MLGYIVGHRPHNPLVVGSSPTCPTFSTPYLKAVFAYYALPAEKHFYANFTHLTASNQQRLAHLGGSLYGFLPNSLIASICCSFLPICCQLLLQVRNFCVIAKSHTSQAIASKHFILKFHRILNAKISGFLICSKTN